MRLSAGTFFINGGNYILINKGITLRGAGPGLTTLAKTNGAKPFQSEPGPHPSPLVVVGTSLFSTTGDSIDVVASTNLTADAAKGAYTVTVANAAGFVPGQIVLLDEASGADWRTDPAGARANLGGSRLARRLAEAQSRRPICRRFRAGSLPDHASVRRLVVLPVRPPHLRGQADRFDLRSHHHVHHAHPYLVPVRPRRAAIAIRTPARQKCRRGRSDDDGRRCRQPSLQLGGAVLGQERRKHRRGIGEGVAIHSSFRIELREFYIHDAAWAQPGGGGYAISLSAGAAEVLIENGIAVRANKVIVARSAGAGSVVGYNYMDMSYINTNGAWIETGINASHMVGSHHVLFEGNESHNADSDNTHGNSIYNTFFRNHLRCIRAPFDNQAGGRIDDAKQPSNGPRRCVGAMAYSYWMSFAGNVLGAANQMDGFAFETTFASGKPGIWMLGWDTVKPYRTDAQVSATALRHGNFDYLTNTVQWDEETSNRALPNSLYLSRKPAFFEAGRGYVWPWVDPVGTTKLHTLPAKARYDAGTPFTQP